MAEIATIARPYADALFQASSADSSGTQAWLQAFANVASNSELLAFANNPKATAAQIIDVLLSASKVTPTAAASNFLAVVVENGRLDALPEIAAQYQVLKNKVEGVSDAVIHSAFPVEANALSDLVALLEKRFDRKLKCSVQIDANLIGGIRVVVGDEVLDTSVRARLDQMKAALVA